MLGAERMQHERVWVISCDMPLVDWNVAQELEDYLMDGIDAVIPVGKTGKNMCSVHGTGNLYGRYWKNS